MLIKQACQIGMSSADALEDLLPRTDMDPIFVANLEQANHNMMRAVFGLKVGQNLNDKTPAEQERSALGYALSNLRAPEERKGAKRILRRCPQCKKMLSARELRRKCPNHLLSQQ